MRRSRTGPLCYIMATNAQAIYSSQISIYVRPGIDYKARLPIHDNLKYFRFSYMLNYAELSSLIITGFQKVLPETVQSITNVPFHENIYSYQLIIQMYRSGTYIFTP